MKEVIKNIINKLEERAEEHDFEGNRFAERKYWEDYCAEKNNMNGLKEAIEIVEQEAAEYNNGWIPCSVALPPQPKANPKLDGRYVELYMVSESESDYPFRAFWNGKAFTDGMFPLDVVAWQPLPEPYQPKGE